MKIEIVNREDINLVGRTIKDINVGVDSDDHHEYIEMTFTDGYKIIIKDDCCCCGGLRYIIANRIAFDNYGPKCNFRSVAEI